MSAAVPMPRDPKRILIIKPSSLGDVVHTLPVLVLLRRRYPDAHITWMVAPYCAGLIQGLPQLNDILLFDRKRLGSAWRSPTTLKELLALKRTLRDRQFDLVLDLQGLFRSGYLAWQTRAPVRIGFANAREGAWIFYTHKVRIDNLEQHAIDRYVKIAQAAGCDAAPIEFPFPVKPEHELHVEELIGSLGPFAVLMPGTNWLTKRWPAEKFNAMVRPLQERLGLTSVIAGGNDAIELARQIPDAINLAGKTNLPQLVALLQRADLVIANDSGPMHIAAALGRPLITLFGPTNPIRTGPYQRMESVVRKEIDCSPCYSRRCSHRSCLQQLDPATVLAAAEEQLHKRHRLPILNA